MDQKPWQAQLGFPVYPHKAKVKVLTRHSLLPGGSKEELLSNLTHVVAESVPYTLLDGSQLGPSGVWKLHSSL